MTFCHEGVCSYDLSGILYEFIINLKYFTLDKLNNRLQYFNYGLLEVQNKPQSNINGYNKK